MLKGFLAINLKSNYQTCPVPLNFCFFPCSYLGGIGVRLVGGTSELEGRVEIFHEGAWGTICDDSWDSMDAQVVCRQLGFLGQARALGSAHFGMGTGEIVMDNVQCVGTELTLRACDADIAEHNCAHSKDASVICSDGNNMIGKFCFLL